MERGGQVSGLVAAAQPGARSLVTGLHTGPVPLFVEALDAAPPLDDRGGDVVEVSFTTPTTALWLQAFQDSAKISLPPRAPNRCATAPPVWTPRTRRTSARRVSRRSKVTCCSCGRLRQRAGRGGAAGQRDRGVLARGGPGDPAAAATPAPPTMDELAEQAYAEDAQRDREAQAAAEQPELWTWGGRRSRGWPRRWWRSTGLRCRSRRRSTTPGRRWTGGPGSEDRRRHDRPGTGHPGPPGPRPWGGDGLHGLAAGTPTPP